MFKQVQVDFMNNGKDETQGEDKEAGEKDTLP